MQALCPVTDPGPLTFHFTLHDPTQTNSLHVCTVDLLSKKIPASSCLPLTHTQRRLQMGLRLITDLIASPVVGLDLLVPPAANCQTTLIFTTLVSSLDLHLLHFTATKPLVLLTN